MAFDDNDKELIAEFKRLLEEYKAAMTKGLKEFADTGAVTGETRERFVKLEALVNSYGDKMAELGKAHETKMVELVKNQETEMRAIKERLSRPPGMGGGPGDGFAAPPSLGQLFCESDEFKAAVNGGGGRGFKVQKALKARVERKIITEFPVPPGYPIIPRRIGFVIPQPMMPLVMRDLLTVVPLDGTNAVEYVKETWTLNANYQVAEGDRKAESTVAYALQTAIVRTIAHFVKISRQMLSDVPFIMSSIDLRLVYGVNLKEDYELLWGDNSAGHLYGLMPQAQQVPADYLTGTENRFDELLGAATYIASFFYPPTAFVLNPLDWAQMQIQKTQIGTYILGGPPQSEAIPRMWGLPVALSYNMTAGNYLCGSFPANAALFDRESALVEISYENEDDFVKNLATIRCEERITLAVFAGQAFAKGPFRMPVVPPPLAAQASGTKK